MYDHFINILRFHLENPVNVAPFYRGGAESFREVTCPKLLSSKEVSDVAIELASD